METRSIGDTGLVVGAIGLGCMGMSHAYDAAERNDEVSVALLRECPSLGVTLIDTAPVYGPFRNEELVGRALREMREDVVIATKCGLVTASDGTIGRNARPESIRAECDESLRRLGIDVIDLYQLHRVDPEVPIEESWGAMADLLAQGKVRALGLSEATIDEAQRAHALHPVSAMQSELSLWTRQWVDDVLPWTIDNNITFLPYAPLGRGFLTGAITPDREFATGDLRATNPRFQTNALAANQPLVDEVRAIAHRHDATPAQVALAWLLQLAPTVIPIPGTKRPDRLRENAAAASLRLTSEECARLNELPAPVGPRY